MGKKARFRNKGDKMNNFYAKTILYAYRNLDAVTRQLDDLVLKRALASMNDLSPCETQCEKILSLTDQKDVLINLKLVTKSVVDKFTEDEKDYLDYKYFKLKPKEYYADFDFTSRAYFRKQVRVADKFAKRLEKAGITDEYFEDKCLSIEFFRELLKRVTERENNFSKQKDASVSVKISA